ncbi:MAG: hypothetical protein EB830_02000 [Nitrosopumilus sp. H13]|nr:MAG: hypothetical protein EB830_02000 [Nitrosopumilus sp. H13]
MVVILVGWDISMYLEIKIDNLDLGDYLMMHTSIKRLSDSLIKSTWHQKKPIHVHIIFSIIKLRSHKTILTDSDFLVIFFLKCLI